MENYIKQHEENKQVSMTGARAFILLLALKEKPRSFEEIRQLLRDCGVADKQYSIDTIRIDINTLKAIGCDISKATKNTNNQYRLLDQPFKFSLSSDEVSTLKSIYRKYVSKTDISLGNLLDFHKLFVNLSEMVEDKEIKESLLGISLLRHENIDILSKLVENETKHNKLIVSYKPATSDLCEYEITMDKVEFRNNKVYVMCYNHTTQQRMMLNTSRVKAVLDSLFDKASDIGLDVVVQFKLKNYESHKLEENEMVISENDGCALIKGRYFNEFIAVQRMLYLGSDCIIEEPNLIKTQVINKLKEMRVLYGM